MPDQVLIEQPPTTVDFGTLALPRSREATHSLDVDSGTEEVETAVTIEPDAIIEDPSTMEQSSVLSSLPEIFPDHPMEAISHEEVMMEPHNKMKTKSASGI